VSITSTTAWPAAESYGDRRVGGGVRDRVADQVGDDLAQAVLVADDDQRCGGVEMQRHRAGRGGGVGAVDDVRRQRNQVDRLRGERALLIQAGQEQQVVHQERHSPGLVLDAVDQAGDVVFVRYGAVAVQLGKTADDGEWGA
jgi:hypothetical protein